MIRLCFLAISKTSLRRVRAVVAPVGLHPYYPLIDIGSSAELAPRTGIVYNILGFGLDEGQFSRISRRDDEISPSASVSTSVDPDSVREIPLTAELAYHLTTQRLEDRDHTTGVRQIMKDQGGAALRTHKRASLLEQDLPGPRAPVWPEYR